jgi:hypothetical protein
VHELKRLHPEAVPAALEKARHYRLLNEPMEAESICLDVLEVDPGNEKALVLLVLAATDRFDDGQEVLARALPQARAALGRLRSDYDRAYFGGIVLERQAKARLKLGGMGTGEVAHELLQQAMASFESAAALAEAGNDDALLRYNTCVRLLASRPDVKAAPRHAPPAMLE